MKSNINIGLQKKKSYNVNECIGGLVQNLRSLSLQKQILKTPLAAVEQQKYSVIQFYLMVPYCKSNSSRSLLLFGSI